MRLFKRKKKLLAVSYADPNDEVERIKKRMDAFKPSSVGLEYTEKQAKLLGSGTYFDMLASYAKQSDSGVVYLDNFAFQESFRVANIALQVVEEGAREELVEEMEISKQGLDELRADFGLVAPEKYLHQHMLYTRLVNALKTVDSLKTPEKVQREIENIAGDRCMYLLGIITYHKPDLVVIGFQHADRIGDKLPDYDIIPHTDI